MVRNTYASVVTSKGQTTVPKEVRTRLGLKQGDHIEFIAENGRMIIRRARRGTNPFTKFAGALGTFKGAKKQINAWVSELRDE